MPSTLRYPVFTKAITSSNGGSWKDQAHICYSPEELQKVYKTIKAERILVQEYIDKENEISINGGEEVFMPYACHYYRMTKDSYGNYMYFFPFKDKELISKIKELIKKARFTGIFCIEFLVDKHGQHYFLEVNFRNSGWSYAFTYGGFNLPFRWAVSMIDNKLYLDSFTPKEKYDVMEEFADLRDCVKHHKEISIRKWLKQYHYADCCYIYNKKDKKPFFMEIMQFIKRKMKFFTD